MSLTLDKASLAASAQTLAAKDPAIADILHHVGGPSLWRRPLTLATLIRIILEQQVSLASARGTFNRLQSACGKVTADSVLGFGDDKLRELGFSRQKARYTLALAEHVRDGSFKIGRLRHLDDDAVREQVTSQLGMGNWTADMVLLLVLCRSDIFPVGDLAIVRGIAELDGCRYDDQEAILARAEDWRPYRSVATRLIWKLYLHNRQKRFDG